MGRHIMNDIIIQYFSNEIYSNLPINSNIIFIDDKVFKLTMDIFDVSREYLESILEDIMLNHTYELVLLKLETLPRQYDMIKSIDDNYYILSDMLTCVRNMKIRNIHNVWYEYLRYLERVISDEMILKIKTLR